VNGLLALSILIVMARFHQYEFAIRLGVVGAAFPIMANVKLSRRE